MSRRARRHGSGGRTGQHYNATPQLRSYTQPPAGPVTITRADGTVEVKPAEKPKNDVPKPRRPKATDKDKRKPKPLRMPTERQLLLVDCPACGAIEGMRCTVRQGHAARVEAYRSTTGRGVPAAKVPDVVAEGRARRLEKLSPKPVDEAERERRRQQSAAAKAVNARRTSGNPYKSPNTRAVSPKQVLAVRCPACRADAGVVCNARDAAGRPALHLERKQAARSLKW